MVSLRTMFKAAASFEVENGCLSVIDITVKPMSWQVPRAECASSLVRIT